MSDVSKDKMEGLLGITRQILAHQKEIRIARGETFNVFSVLDVERKENNTHSAFLAELLNPKGSHYRGTAFLSLFLDTVPCKPTLDLNSATVVKEKYVGKVDLDAKLGGKIDIYIKDTQDNSICIENKIGAPEQQHQVERYCNHNKAKNRVYYLTLKGDEPTPYSKGNLVSGKDYYLISYKVHIIKWLEKCIKEAAEVPILRESIKQYKILIQKLTNTNTMDNQHEQQLAGAMFKHYKEARYIARNFSRLTDKLKEDFREQVAKDLAAKLGTNLNIEKGYTVSNSYAQIWLKLKDFPDSDVYFGLETFSGSYEAYHKGNLFVGIFDRTGGNADYSKIVGRVSDYWLQHSLIPDFDGYKMHLSNSDTLFRLHSDKNFFTAAALHIVSHTVAYVEEQLTPLLTFLNSTK